MHYYRLPVLILWKELFFLAFFFFLPGAGIPLCSQRIIHLQLPAALQRVNVFQIAVVGPRLVCCFGLFILFFFSLSVSLSFSRSLSVL